MTPEERAVDEIKNLMEQARLEINDEQRKILSAHEKISELTAKHQLLSYSINQAQTLILQPYRVGGGA